MSWLAAAAVVLSFPSISRADEAVPDSADAKSQDWAIQGQTTSIEQGNLAFRSPYAGANSLDPNANGRESFDATLLAGVRPWTGAEIWFNPEVDQGYGLSGTVGAAGFTNGESGKVGSANPYLRIQRLFLRQTIDLSGEKSKIDADLNQLAGSQTANRIVVTIGKISPPDIFDANKYAHDSRQDFLNWALVDTGSYDYAADAWGYTVGAVAEWYEGSWTARLGVFDLSATPNSTQLDAGVGQFQWQGELEKRFQIHGEGGAIRLTGFLSRGRMGRFADALALAAANGTTPDIAAVREYRSRGGIGVSLDQQIRDDLGLFVRAGLAGGDVEPFDYTDIDRTAALGLSLNGKKWGRGGDTVAIAGVVNGISSVHEAFLAAGGLGILVGDGRLPHPGPEQILESYYDAEIRKFLHIALDYQFIDNPAYNRDRGPVSVFGARLHIQF